MKPKTIQRLIFWPILSIVLFCILGNAIPGILRQIDASNRTSSIGQSKQIHTAIMSYAQEHNGKFPQAATAQAAFQKLIDTDCIDADTYFRLTKTNPNKGDKTIDRGENKWAYTSGLTMSSKSETPLIAAPMISQGIFDPKPLKGYAVIMTIAGSTTAQKIRPDGTIHLTRPDGITYNPFLKQNLPPNTKILLPN